MIEELLKDIEYLQRKFKEEEITKYDNYTYKDRSNKIKNRNNLNKYNKGIYQEKYNEKSY